LKKVFTLLFIILGVALLGTGCGALILYNFGSWEASKYFSTTFSAINSLFAGFAFAGMIYTIILQSKELQLQREELSLTRSELAKSAIAQEKQVEMALNTAKLNAAISKYETYSNFITNQIIYPEQINYRPGDQRDYLATLEKEIDLLLKKTV